MDPEFLEGLRAYLAGVAAATGLTCAFISARSRTPLSLIFAFLCLDQFAWNAATLGASLAGHPAWTQLGAVTSPLFVPLALNLVLRFVGQGKRWRAQMIVAYSIFGVQSLGALFASLWSASDRVWAILSTALLLASVPAALVAVWTLVAYYRSTDDASERRSTALLLAGIAVFAPLGASELLHDIGLRVPPLAHLGSLALNAFVAPVALAAQSSGAPTTSTLGRMGTPLLGATAVMTAYLLIFASLHWSVAWLAIATGTFTLLVVIGGQYLGHWWLRDKTQLQHLAGLGRFSAQMAHDVRNPLAAARGAMQLVEEELRRMPQASVTPTALSKNAKTYLNLAVEQLDRLANIVSRYQRMAKLELEVHTLDPSAIAQHALSAAETGQLGSLRLATKVSPALPSVRGDGTLLTIALENLVRNAAEAMPNGGDIEVLVDPEHRKGSPGIAWTVRDSGKGMNARIAALAFEPFFSNKPSGSGLGLAFVRDVARAHGGEATLRSSLGQGTRVTLWIPESPPRQPQGEFGGTE